MTGLVILVCIITSMGQLCQKQAALQLHRRGYLFWMIVSVIILGIGMLLWLVVLQQMPVSVAYPMLSLNFIFVALGARWIWGERLSGMQIIGTLLIVSGVIVMGS
ncbi:4-amino-4-deoxy-L-arabinose-phosphoundecaprenol flippase subunit ArnE [Nissabacter sp. SGAir0207]|uniref:4-amino-4-deoxy-L-arabinose-phosphoundecaprenol flippase subunit ArnE n=1 Tax=Nissabacter sp. SGAir0207 TaxID=2126321 RepID=UPI0010CD3FBF|nr:4-amino-4-deoxy-L-arabinose-phosphoundecaprenol flippase subunit ArnE [Nissabacter sp. SGAir0207]QCR38641.1 4-amino-4-deoxy-L-arabinose-phospho-UDP flippase [Nissabacter sp. SGAir0207]